MARARTRALRATAVGFALGWFWKASFFVDHLREAAAYPVDVDTLPGVLQVSWIAAFAYGLPLAGLPLVCLRHRSLRIAGAITLAAAAALACAHVELFNDATFVTSFWTGLWLVWLAAASADDVRRHGARLARSVVAMIFLGGLVGKLTSEYTSGEALYHLYFVQKDQWPYGALRRALSPESLRAVARLFSIGAIAAEATLALGPVWPHRTYVVVAASTMVLMVLTSTFYLLSVMAPLVGLLMASWWLAGPRLAEDPVHE